MSRLLNKIRSPKILQFVNENKKQKKYSSRKFTKEKKTECKSDLKYNTKKIIVSSTFINKNYKIRVLFLL